MFSFKHDFPQELKQEIENSCFLLQSTDEHLRIIQNLINESQCWNKLFEKNNDAHELTLLIDRIPNRIDDFVFYVTERRVPTKSELSKKADIADTKIRELIQFFSLNDYWYLHDPIERLKTLREDVQNVYRDPAIPDSVNKENAIARFLATDIKSYCHEYIGTISDDCISRLVEAATGHYLSPDNIKRISPI